MSSIGSAEDDDHLKLLTLRKPTALKLVIDSIPKPLRAVPKNGLPMWYNLALESKLPVPDIPKNKITFSRGKIGEDIRRLGLGTGPRPSFTLSDPHCYNMTFEYDSMHDPHLSHHFSQKPARDRMKELGLVTKDNRAVCTLKEFNNYRKYLSHRFEDRIHMEMAKLDERARDDITLMKVERDVARKSVIFERNERIREQLEKAAQANADIWAEKKRMAREQEKKVKAHLQYLAEFNEKQRRERIDRANEREERIKQRVTTAAEMELRRKITMVRTWRSNEKKRLKRLSMERQKKEKEKENTALNKWNQRIYSQNNKISEDAELLKMYSDDMNAGAWYRKRRADNHAYHVDLQRQRLKSENLKIAHGSKAKEKKLIRVMGENFEKSKRGAKGMSRELAMELAKTAVTRAMSTKGDPFMELGQARTNMDAWIVLPLPPQQILEEVLEIAIMEYARRHVTAMIHVNERMVRDAASKIFFQYVRPIEKPVRKHQPLWANKVISEMNRHNRVRNHGTIVFGEIVEHDSEDFHDIDLKSVKDRPPTPVPSKTKLAEVTFADRIEDLPTPETIGSSMPERAKLLQMVRLASKLLSVVVNAGVLKGMDPITGKVTLPTSRRPLEWGEAVETLSNAVVNQRINKDCGELRRAGEFLTRRILMSLQAEMKEEKAKLKAKAKGEKGDGKDIASQQDFYNPNALQKQQSPDHLSSPIKQGSLLKQKLKK